MKNITVLKIFLLLFLSIAFSCQKKKELETIAVESDSKEDIVTELPANSEFTFLESAPERKLPLIDSTNFDNFSSKKFLSQSQLELIQSKKIADNSENLVVNYKLNLSENFKTFIFTYNKGEMELFSTLVNYDNNYKFISKLDISYDEIAESWFRTESKINHKEIIVNKLNYTEETEKSNKTVYKILENGLIVKK